MEYKKGDVHILVLDDEEMNLNKQAIEFFHECTIKSQEFKNNDESTVQTAIKLEEMCQGMRIKGFEFS